MILKKKWVTIAARCLKMRTVIKKVGLSMMREWTEKIQAKEMSMVMKTTRWKTRKRKGPTKSSQFKNRTTKRHQRLTKRIYPKRKNHLFQEHHGDKKRKKKKNKPWLINLNQKRTTRSWHRCRPTGLKRKRPSSSRTMIITRNFSTIALQPINVS